MALPIAAMRANKRRFLIGHFSFGGAIITNEINREISVGVLDQPQEAPLLDLTDFGCDGRLVAHSHLRTAPVRQPAARLIRSASLLKTSTRSRRSFDHLVSA